MQHTPSWKNKLIGSHSTEHSVGLSHLFTQTWQFPSKLLSQQSRHLRKKTGLWCLRFIIIRHNFSMKSKSSRTLQMLKRKKEIQPYLAIAYNQWQLDRQRSCKQIHWIHNIAVSWKTIFLYDKHLSIFEFCLPAVILLVWIFFKSTICENYFHWLYFSRIMLFYNTVLIVS